MYRRVVMLAALRFQARRAGVTTSRGNALGLASLARPLSGGSVVGAGEGFHLPRPSGARLDSVGLDPYKSGASAR